MSKLPYAHALLTATAVVFGTGCADDGRSAAFDSMGSAPGAASGPDGGSSGDRTSATGTATDPGSGPGALTTDGPEDDGSDESPALDVAAPDEGGSADDSGTNGEGCQFIDLLFVVDISASMTQEKANLAANFPAFVAVLDAFVNAGNTLGYRLGVTNSSINAVYDGCETTMGFDGVLTSTGGIFGTEDCGTGGTPWLDGPGPAIAQGFSCLAENPITPGGGTDCGHERPLGVVERFIAAAAPGGDNDGFYRGEASLLVVVNLTDEDEDQAWTDTTPQQTKAALDTFAGGEERYVAVTIAGPMPCESVFGDATEATVLKQFTDLVPNGLFGDICEGDLAAPLAEALELIQSSCDTLPPPEG